MVIFSTQLTPSTLPVQTPVNPQPSSSQVGTVGCSALASLQSSSNAGLNCHSFPVQEWVFEVGGCQFTLDFNGGQLSCRPFNLESDGSRYQGKFADSLEAAKNSVENGSDFAVVENADTSGYTHTVVFKSGDAVMTRPLNFTCLGEKNGGPSIHTSMDQFVGHSVQYADKYAVSVS